MAGNSSLLSRVGLDAAARERRLAFLGFDAADDENLAALRAFARANVDRIVDEEDRCARAESAALDFRSRRIRNQAAVRHLADDPLPPQIFSEQPQIDVDEIEGNTVERCLIRTVLRAATLELRLVVTREKAGA